MLPGNDTVCTWGSYLRVTAAFGRRLPLAFRMDAAFSQRDVLRLLAARGCAYAIKVGYWSWLPLKQLAAYVFPRSIGLFTMDRSRCSPCADPRVHVGPIWVFTFDRNPHLDPLLV